MNRLRLMKDRFAQGGMLAITVLCGLLVLFIAAGLYLRSRQVLAGAPLGSLLFSHAWKPDEAQFGFMPFILGTAWVTLTAVVIAVPLSLLTAIYLSEYAHRRWKDFMDPVIDVLAGIPSVIYGVWGIILIVPLSRDVIAPATGRVSSGYCVLTGGIVLAVMILPVIIHVSLEVLKTVPRELREASLSVGATRWQTIKHVVLPKALPGIIAANVLGLSRAFGETMAVLMVTGGNMPVAPRSLLDPAYPLPALFANKYGEMFSIPLYDSALMFAALILFAIVTLFSVLSRLVLIRIERMVR